MPTQKLHAIDCTPAERRIINGLLIDNRTYWRGAERLQPSDFSDDMNQKIFMAIQELAALERPFSTVDVYEHIGHDSAVLQYMADMNQNELGGVGSFENYIGHVEKHAARRHLKERLQSWEMAIDNGDDIDTVWRTIANEASGVPRVKAHRLQSIPIADLLSLELPPREFLLYPWLPKQGLAMIHAPRGIGKTWVGLNVGCAVASGGEFLDWKADRPGGVLYIDGEMPASTMQERLATIVDAHDAPINASFDIVTPDLCIESGMPDLASTSGQAAIDRLVTDDTKLIVIDNLSCLAPHCDENKADSWTPLQTWALRHRAAGRSVLFVHHSGKGGQQRGTSRREDVMDTVIGLSRPPDYTPDQGAVFVVNFEKARSMIGETAKSIVASLTTGSNGKPVWAVKKGDESRHEKIVSMLNDGMKPEDIGTDLSCSRATVYRHQKRAQEAGELA